MKKKHREKSRLLIVSNLEVLVLRKNTEKKAYGLIGGFSKKGETPESCLIRETFEEVGVCLNYHDFEYISTFCNASNNKPVLTRHYFLLKDIRKTFLLREPHKFSGIEWVNWMEACQYLGASDKNALERFFFTQRGIAN